MPPYELRPATNADIGAVKEIVFSVLEEYGLEANPDDTDADLDDLEGQYVACGGSFDVMVEADGEVVGTVGLFPIDAATCELRKMYLRPSARGSGLGKRLLEHALQRAGELGFRRVTLETASVLKAAIRLYTAYGFVRHHPPHLAKRCDAAYVLELPARAEAPLEYT